MLVVNVLPGYNTDVLDDKPAVSCRMSAAFEPTMQARLRLTLTLGPVDLDLHSEYVTTLSHDE